MTDELLPIPKVPEGLREAAQLGRLIPFVGAGASRLAGCPSWPEFADLVLKCLIDQGNFTYSEFDQVKHLLPRVKLSIARNLAKEKSALIDYRAVLHPSLWREHKNGSRLYNSLFELGKTFVTTNYDQWLDERRPGPLAGTTPLAKAANTSPIPAIRVVHQPEHFIPSLLSEPNTVTHLHGSLLEPNGMILTTRDYMQHYANDRSTSDPHKENRVLTFLDSLFADKTVLFIGYGLEELEILEYVIQKSGARADRASKREPSHYLLQGYFSHQTVFLEKMKSYYRTECDVHLIPFLLDHKGFDQLIDVLEDFAQRIPASEPAVLLKMREMEEWLDE